MQGLSLALFSFPKKVIGLTPRSGLNPSAYVFILGLLGYVETLRQCPIWNPRAEGEAWPCGVGDRIGEELAVSFLRSDFSVTLKHKMVALTQGLPDLLALESKTNQVFLSLKGKNLIGPALLRCHSLSN